MLASNLSIPSFPRIYPFNHSSVQCYFKPSPRDFVVKEIPLYELSGVGEHCFMYVRKKNLSTFELLSLLASVLGCKVRDIGYGGLKDKAASTYQYISIPALLRPKLEEALDFLKQKQVKILHTTLHNNKLKVGHLKGNRFFIRLKKCTPPQAKKLESTLELLAQSGFPNYFGYQRFGKEGDNFKTGEALAHKALRLRNKKMSNFLISSYQSYLFNAWLACRITFSQIIHHFSPNEALESLRNSKLSPLVALGERCSIQMLKEFQTQEQPFVLLNGDVMCHYPFGKTFVCDEASFESKRFIQRFIAPTGALCGSKLVHSDDLALLCEEAYLDKDIEANGSRRYAWVWAEDIESKYIPQNAHFELQFTLPKGSYATIFLESLLARNFNSDETNGV